MWHLKNTIAYLMMSFKMSFISNKKMLLRLKKLCLHHDLLLLNLSTHSSLHLLNPWKGRFSEQTIFNGTKKCAMECSRFFVNCDDASFTFSFGNGTIFCFHLNESTGSIKCFPLKMLYCLHLRQPFCLPFRPLFPLEPWTLIFYWIQSPVVVMMLCSNIYIIKLTDNLRQCVNSSEICLSHR